GEALVHPGTCRRYPAPCRRPARPHLQPRPWRPARHAGRPREGARRHGPRDVLQVIDGVLLIAFGGPTKPDEIRPFLQNVTRGRRIPPERLEDVAHHYEQMPGGRSPLNDLTFMQARSLAAMLAGVNVKLPVFVGMRNWKPYLYETLGTMAAKR